MLYWQLNDTWPVCSWSGLDHGGNWKLLHHMARVFYQPVLVTAVPKGDAITLVAVNDRPDPVMVTVRAHAVDMTGRTRPLAKGQAEVSGAAIPLCTVKLADLRPDEMLAYSWEGSDGTADHDVFAHRPYKSYDLQAPRLSAKVDGCELLLSVQSLALFVAVEADIPGRFSANGFAMLPGQPVALTFTPDDPKAQPHFTFRDLHSATHGPS
jgi:beta-mannosidase